MKQVFTKPIVRLGISYLAIIMTMSIGFSVVFYTTSVRELGRTPGAGYYEAYPEQTKRDFDDWLAIRADVGRSNLAVTLLVLNIGTLFGGTLLSYFLARKTLAPIHAAMRAQDRFVADASHELRTPLAGVLLTNEVALRKKC